MESKLKAYFVTVRIDESRTRDYRVMAASEYNAKWIHTQINQGAKIIGVRLVDRSTAVNS
jgi:hypothetical protein